MKPETVDQYIENAPEQHRQRLTTLRQLIMSIVPDAEESMSYGMPAYRFHGVLLYFALASRHIGLYPRASGVEYFNTLGTSYKSSKGAIRFPLNQDLPLGLIEKLIRHRVTENCHDRGDRLF